MKDEVKELSKEKKIRRKTILGLCIKLSLGITKAKPGYFYWILSRSTIDAQHQLMEDSQLS